jgi:hypothetical protein
MAAQREGRAKGRRHVGGLNQLATAQRFRSTLDYMDIRPYNLPERSTVNVEISPLLRGFIWTFRRIIAQPGILSLKIFGVMAEGNTRAPGRSQPEA